MSNILEKFDLHGRTALVTGGAGLLDLSRGGFGLVEGGVVLVEVGAFIAVGGGSSTGAVGICGALGGVVVVLDVFLVVLVVGGIEVRADFGLSDGWTGDGGVVFGFFLCALVLVVML